MTVFSPNMTVFVFNKRKVYGYNKTHFVPTMTAFVTNETNLDRNALNSEIVKHCPR